MRLAAGLRGQPGAGRHLTKWVTGCSWDVRRRLVVLWNLICLQWRWRTPCASRGVAVHWPGVLNSGWLVNGLVSLWRNSEQFCEQLPQLTGLIMDALWNRAGHYIFALWFIFFFFFSSPNLSGRRLDVYHTSTHGVAKMQVWNLLHAARWKCRTQKCRQKSPSAWAPLHNFVGLYLRLRNEGTYRQSKKNLLSSDMSSSPHVPTIWWTSAY